MKTLFSPHSHKRPQKRKLAILLSSLSLSISLTASAVDLSTQKLFAKWNNGTNPTNYEMGNAHGTIAANEKWIIVGTPLADEGGFNQGAVQVFNAATGLWVRKLSHPVVTSSETLMGQSCAISGDTALIGVPGPNSTVGSVLVFNLANGRLLNTLTLGAENGSNGDRFGASIAIFGKYALIGSPNDDAGKGSAYIINYTDKTVVRKLTDAGGSADDLFGISVAAEGNVGIIGSLTMDNEGGFVAVDLTTGAVLKRFTPTSALAGDSGGSAVTLTKGMVLMSAIRSANPTRGLVVAYNLLTEDETVLTSSDIADGDQFGSSISITRSGLVIVGAKGDNSGVGAAYVFDLTSDSDEEIMKLQAPSGLAVGSAVALVGDQAVIAASATPSISINAETLLNVGSLFLIKPITNQMSITKITARGDFAPGAENIAFNTFGDISINADGEIALTSTLSGTGSNRNRDTGIWSTLGGGNLALTTKSRFPFTGNTTINVVSRALCNAPDRAIYQASLLPIGGAASATSNNNQLVIFGPNLATDRFRSGEKIASFEVPVTFTPADGALPLNFTQVVQSRNSAAASRLSIACTLRVGFNGTVATNDSGIFTTDFALPLTTQSQREGFTAIATPSPVLYGQFAGRIAQYDALTVFSAALAGVARTVDQALFTRTFNGASTAISRKGDVANDGTLPTPLAITGTAFASYIGESTDEDSVLYRATITGTAPNAVPAAQNEGLWLHNGTVSRQILRKGVDLTGFTTNYNPTPVISELGPTKLAGIRIARFISFWQTNDQQLALVQLAGAGVNSSNDQALILVQNSPLNQLNVLLREGQAAPNCGGATIGVINRVEVEPYRGTYLVLTTLVGAARGTELALFQGASSLPVTVSTDTLRSPHLVLRKGQLFDNQPSKVKSFSLPTTNLTVAGAGATGLGRAIQEGVDPAEITESAIVVEFDNGVRQVMKGKL